MNAPEKLPLVLRAELHLGGETLVTRTREASASEIMLSLQVPVPLGARAFVRLSFPGLAAPFSASGAVGAHHASDGPGEAPSITVQVDDASSEYRARLAQLVTPAPAEATSREYRILLVEDERVIRETFAQGVHGYFKARGGVVVDVAPDGAAAWSMLADSRYDVAIVDSLLPVASGAQLLTRMRSEPRLASVPTVAIGMAGADLSLDSPRALRDLFATIDRLLSVHRSS